MSHPVPRLIWP